MRLKTEEPIFVPSFNDDFLIGITLFFENPMGKFRLPIRLFDIAEGELVHSINRQRNCNFVIRTIDNPNLIQLLLVNINKGFTVYELGGTGREIAFKAEGILE
ncbi:hypothetical protein KIH39_08215 [Telmatocola sphagniphila]|uniref:Uncharacterized protein n=1 Tax=Telmatocola sphagniphila TaxID=1123043 RepID=A0A8E6EWK1_9BACT|nr:hypothetical protein [Telmatocola sphagniphila]QVL33877.1 hypothetical protein KIH39_08215 [Telmatocola sphagniphila]